jgi:uncharacterized protein YjiS (DUF1127 family)
MIQTKTRQPETAAPTYRIDPFGALVGYAAVYEAHDTRPTPARSGDTTREAFVPSCPFQWSPPTSGATTAAAELSDAALGEDAAPCSLEQPRSWPARLWSRYAAWRERQRLAATWEALDTRTLRDIGALPGEDDPDMRSIPYWGWHTIL